MTKKNGLNTEILDTGMTLQTHYKNGLKDGSETYYYASGQKASEGYYADNKLEGSLTYWYENGHMASEGFYKLTIDDGTGCLSEDSITITEENPPTTIVSGGGNMCEDGSSVNVIFSFNGAVPWDLTYSDGTSSFNQNGINSPIYNFIGLFF